MPQKFFVIAFSAFFCSLIFQKPLYAHYQPTKILLINRDTNKLQTVNVAPEYPGGVQAFYKFLSEHIQMPKIAILTGAEGKVVTEFVVEEDGSIKKVTALSHIGLGIDSEVVRAVKLSPRWKPATQNGKAVRIKYTIPVSFTSNLRHVFMDSLKVSGYGFVFQINGKTYSIANAEKLLGPFFSPEKIEMVVPYQNQNKYQVPAKKEVYLLKIKN